MQGNKALVQSFFDAGNRGDFDGCFALIGDDIVWTNIGSTRFSGTFRGKDQVMSELIEPLFGRLKAGIHSTVENLIAEGDVVVAQSTGSAETHDGRPYNNTYCQVMRLKDGKIVEVREYFDTELVTRTFG
jgi:ketosteroid isomerase-like protein